MAVELEYVLNVLDIVAIILALISIILFVVFTIYQINITEKTTQIHEHIKTLNDSTVQTNKHLQNISEKNSSIHELLSESIKKEPIQKENINEKKET